jgi:hypothetical protein
MYHESETQVDVKCGVCYIPFEGRMDSVSFELMLIKAQPKELIIINTTEKKASKIEEFCKLNDLHTKVHFKKHLNFSTNAAVKQVFIDEALYKGLPL